jgi:hypothetical protein
MSARPLSRRRQRGAEAAIGRPLLANNSTPVVLPASMDSVTSRETIFSSLLNDRDRIQKVLALARW